MSPARPTGPAKQSPVPMLAAGVMLVALLAVIAFVVVGSNDDGGTASAPSTSCPAAGLPLPPLPDAGDDPAVGCLAPVARGPTFDGESLSVAPTDGPYALVFLAHWCPHCQREVPEITEWIAAGGVPDGVDLYAVATSTDPSRPNYPPDEWLEREGWAVPTIDDQDQAVADAFGLTAFPYFVLVDSGGKVAERFTGEIGTDQLSERLAALGGRA